MKIVFFNTYNKGYLSSFFVEICSALSNLGHDVFIYSLKMKPEFFILDSNVTVTILKRKNRFHNYFTLFNIIKKEKPDVVVSNFSYANPVTFSAKILGVSHNIIWFHTLIKQMNFSRTSIFIKSLFMDMATAIITNSLELKTEVSKDYRQKPTKVYNLPFTTTVENTEIKELDFIKINGKIYIGCPGRLHPDKNQKILIDMLSLLNDNNIILVFAGSKDADVLLNHKDYDKYKDQIIYLGNLSSGQMVDFYNKMDVIILPSFNEAFGLVLIEALASGCNTLVSSRFGALDYIKEDVSSITFDPNNVNDLTSKLKVALIEKKPAKYFKDLYVNNFSMEEIVNQFLLIFKK